MGRYSTCAFLPSISNNHAFVSPIRLLTTISSLAETYSVKLPKIRPVTEERALDTSLRQSRTNHVYIFTNEGLLLHNPFV